MRTARTAYFEKQWLTCEPEDGDQPIIGICLGYDRCAEHEFGIAPMATDFGLTEDHGLGIERHRARTVPGDLAFSKRKARRTRDGKVTNYTLATLSYGLDKPPRLEPDSMFLSSSRHNTEDARIASAWGDHAFCVTVEGEENVTRLQDIHEALRCGDATISLASSSNPFSGSGLSLTIVSRLPQSVIDQVLRQDIEHRQLLEAVENTGIEQLLKDAGCDYYALRPAWFTDPENEGTRQLRFFLNPQDQRNCNYGWFSLEDLQAWAQGAGPVLKTTDDQRQRVRG